jgi:cytochrome c6
MRVITRGNTVVRKLLSLVIIAIAGLTWGWTPSVWASDLASGAKVFAANCAACHVGGNNVINAQKTLKKDALERYQMASLEAIKTQVQQGKAAMPAFSNRLKPEQIDDVAAYVLDQAEKGW